MSFKISFLQEQRRKSLASFRPDHLYQTSLSSTHQIHSKLTLFYLSAVSVPVTVPDPVAVFPLNSKYQTREIESRVPQGNPVGVSLADGPDGKAGVRTRSQAVPEITSNSQIMEHWTFSTL